ncbi:Bifunctional protein FolD [Frankliniella fusca]|uniref:Bifunctional protein FolD n=1 Tax=Frankliniella fusca TaxID=407009 RepID=A0AAE1GZP8_9NEOP|nr:Bifunctional protein FolD [Frankliniella fusca]
MESTLLVQHYAGHIAGENNFQRIVLLQGDQFFGVESVPPEDVVYPHGLGRPEVPNHEAIVEELALEMHRLSLQTSDPGTGAEELSSSSSESSLSCKSFSSDSGSSIWVGKLIILFSGGNARFLFSSASLSEIERVLSASNRDSCVHLSTNSCKSFGSGSPSFISGRLGTALISASENGVVSWLTTFTWAISSVSLSISVSSPSSYSPSFSKSSSNSLSYLSGCSMNTSPSTAYFGIVTHLSPRFCMVTEIGAVRQGRITDCATTPGGSLETLFPNAGFDINNPNLVSPGNWLFSFRDPFALSPSESDDTAWSTT